ncbi:hypothetical protein FPV67DRAFT_473384 [Lyophyllum atratum]|nr:hypothetical protein FPV67DRAFT_473384 [Lyophyllum atratum]
MEQQHLFHDFNVLKSLTASNSACDVYVSRYVFSILQAIDRHCCIRSRQCLGDMIINKMNWEGRPAPVRNPKLVDVLLKGQEAERRPEDGKKDTRSKKGAAVYDDNILLALSDAAEEVARKLMEAQQLNRCTSSSSGAGGAAGSRDIHFVHAHIAYQLLSSRGASGVISCLLRVSVLLSTSKFGPAKKVTDRSQKSRPERVDSRLYPAVVKLLDTVLQSLDPMRRLSIVDGNPELAAAVEGRTSFTKARSALLCSR